MAEKNLMHVADILTAEEITKLTNQFFSTKDAEILSCHLQPFSEEPLGYLAVHQLLRIEARVSSDNNSKKRLLEFFVKCALPNRRPYERALFRTEAEFYKNLLPRLLRDNNYASREPWIAECHLVKEDVLILENLRRYKLVSSLRDDHVTAALTSVARLHAASMLWELRHGRQTLDEVYPGVFDEKIYLKTGLAWKWLLAGIEVAEAVALDLKLRPEYILKAYELTIERVKPVKKQNNVICHCDLWSNNMMFNQSEPFNCVLVDFQMSAYANAAIDIQTFIYLNTTSNDRRDKEKQFIDFYYDALVDNLLLNGYDENSIVSKTQVCQDIEDKRVCGLVSAVQYFPIALLTRESAKLYEKDIERYSYDSRKDFVLRTMQLDASYRDRIESS
ncbi:hypothetical protein TKK_0001465 [Trichogramma kaykai]|uniref:CHK kinase-like domain-containing protein n=1 Tax=Trichogramma kaykai TaxID=54128 RepID=A0ABD2X2S3_9HYME